MYELRASSLGSCTKAQAAILLGYAPLPTPDKVQGWYDRGNAHEEECWDAMVAEGYGITDSQLEARISWSTPDNVTQWEVLGHLDGKVFGPAPFDVDRKVWEAKAPGAWAKFRDAYLRNDWSDPLAHRYAWQISVYMIATGLEALVCCLDDGAVKTFGIEVPPFDLVQIEQRVGEIIDFVEGGLPGSCSQNDWPCPVRYLHMDEEPEVENVEDDEAIVATEEYERLGVIENEAKKQRKVLRPKLDSTYTHAGNYRAGLADVLVYETKESRLSEDLMRAGGLDPEKYKTVKKSLRLKVTRDVPSADV